MSNTGMADSKVKIKIEAVDEASKELRNYSDAAALLQLRILARAIINSSQSCNRNFVYIDREAFENLKKFFE